ncbi:glutathione-dependent formaldehyde-activating protein, partial [Melanomma pulvis-pyrius CBS 109.77]
YQASCHCQLVRYSVTLSPPLHDPESWVVECNCSICARNGSLNVYVQSECLEFETVGLESALKYRFGKQRVQHYFCSRCGSSLMAESIEPGFYEGVRMFHDVDVRTLQRREVDGKSL